MSEGPPIAIPSGFCAPQSVIQAPQSDIQGAARQAMSSRESPDRAAGMGAAASPASASDLIVAVQRLMKDGEALNRDWSAPRSQPTDVMADKPEPMPLPSPQKAGWKKKVALKEPARRRVKENRTTHLASADMGARMADVVGTSLPLDSNPPPREAEMIRLRQDGWTLQEIAMQFCLSRERVRQLLVQFGGPSPAEVRAREQSRAKEKQDRLAASTAVAIRTHLEGSGVASVSEVAQATGLDESDIARFWPDESKHLRIFGSSGDLTWSDAQIVEAIRDAATYEFPLTSAGYAELQRIGEVQGPSLALIAKRFGSWTAACEAADVEHGPTHREHYESHWTDEDLLAFARQYFEDPDFPGSAHRYADWRALKAPDAPSLPTLRNRLGSWTEVKRRVLGSNVGGGLDSRE